MKFNLDPPSSLKRIERQRPSIYSCPHTCYHMLFSPNTFNLGILNVRQLPRVYAKKTGHSAHVIFLTDIFSLQFSIPLFFKYAYEETRIS